MRSIGAGPRISIPIISPFPFRSRMRLSVIGSLSVTFPFFELASYS